MSMGKFYEGPKDGAKYSWILYPRFHVNADRRVDKANSRSSHPEVFCQESVLKDTHREKALSNKTPALTKITNMGIWVAGTTNQLFIRGS